MIIGMELEVNIKGDRANANEIFLAVSEEIKEIGEKMSVAILEGYQEVLIEILCTKSGRVKKKGLGSHDIKGREGCKCRSRTFKRAGNWSDVKRLSGEMFSVEFIPSMVECSKCGKRLTPIIEGLELDYYQGKTELLLRKVMESVAETSYRRGSDQLDRIGEVPVAKSTAHRWVADVELPVSEGRGKPFLGADGTGFKRRGGERGEVRMVLEMWPGGGLRPLGVWAGASWKDIAKEMKGNLKSRPQLFISDGERGLEEWLGKLAESSERCHWHLSRDSGYMLWQDKVSLEDRKEAQKKLSKLLAIEVPEKDVEFVTKEDREELKGRIVMAEKELDELRLEFESKGYTKAANYLSNARDKLFNHLRLWLQTGLIGPRTTSILENIIRELVRRLKKIGWNWSDKGAERMGRVVMMRRYDEESWEEYWEARMNLQGRCTIKMLNIEASRAA
jgi:hypothetical protein